MKAKKELGLLVLLVVYLLENSCGAMNDAVAARRRRAAYFGKQVPFDSSYRKYVLMRGCCATQYALQAIIDTMASVGIIVGMERMTELVSKYPECINMSFGEKVGLPIQYLVHNGWKLGALNLVVAFEQMTLLGADYKCRYADGASLMHIAVVFNHVSLVRYLSIKYPESINMQMTDGGLTPIMIACSLGFKEAFDALMVAGADLNLCDNCGRTVLHYAQGLACGFNPPGSALNSKEACERRASMMDALLVALCIGQGTVASSGSVISSASSMDLPKELQELSLDDELV